MPRRTAWEWGAVRRSLAFMRRQGPAPALIGVAHACQRVESLPVEPWDVPLTAVVSDESIVRAGKKKS